MDLVRSGRVATGGGGSSSWSEEVVVAASVSGVVELGELLDGCDKLCWL